jgi:hypothetical protein
MKRKKLSLKLENCLYQSIDLQEQQPSTPLLQSDFLINQVFNFTLANKNPGPDHYEKAAVAMDKFGTYYVSKFTNSMCRSFVHDKRHGVMEGLKE